MPNISISRRNIHYIDYGRGDAVVLLHGLGSRSDDWGPQLVHLGTSCRVIAPDFAGHGQSSPNASIASIADLADDILTLMNYLNLKKAHLVGFSLGGMVGLQLAASHPDRVKTLTVVNSGPGLAGRRIRIRAQLYLRKAIIHIFGMNSLARVIGKNLFPRPDQQTLVLALANSMEKANQKTYLRVLHAIANLNLLDAMPLLPMPVLVITGDQDYTPISYKQHYASLIPRADLEIVADSRHGTPMDQPKICASLIQNFLQKHSTSGVTI